MKEQNLPRGGAAEGIGVGLTEEQVLASRRLHGANTLTKRKRKGFFRQYLSSFGDPIIKILMVALAINVIFLFRNSDWMESAGIAVAVFLATFVSTLSQYGSESAFIELQRASANIECRVRRAGGIRSLPVGELVVGDLVLLEAGEKLPADGVLLSGRLSVDQSALNGESAETEKNRRPVTVVGILYPSWKARGGRNRLNVYVCAKCLQARWKAVRVYLKTALRCAKC